VDEGVHAGGGGDGRRAAVGEDGVDEADVGDQVGAHDALLHVELLVREDGDGRRLRAGSGRGRHGDERQAFLGDLVDADVVVDGVAGVGQDRRGLGDVDRRTAAEADDEVVAAVLDDAHDLLDGAHGRLGHSLVVEVDLEAGLRQRTLDVDAHAAVADALVGDHEILRVELDLMPSWSTDDAGDEGLGLAVNAHLAFDAAQLGRLAVGGRDDARFGFVVDVVHGSQLSLVSGWRGRRPTP
jgi:hypothetical protein